MCKTDGQIKNKKTRILKLDQNIKTSVNVLIWQNNISSKHFNDMLFHHTNTIEPWDNTPADCTEITYFLPRVENLLLKAEKLISQKCNIDIIVMPELSVLPQSYNSIVDWSRKHKDILIIAGSSYKKHQEKYFHNAVVIHNGHLKYVNKNIPSIHETSERLNFELTQEESYVDFTKTCVGNIRVIVCADALDPKYINSLRRRKQYGMIFIISCQKNPEFSCRQYFAADNLALTLSNKPFVFFVNTYSPSLFSGNSAVFSRAMKSEEKKEITKYSSKAMDLALDYSTLSMVQPNDSRYMVVKCNFSRPQHGNVRMPTHPRPVNIEYIEGLKIHKKFDEHDIKMVIFDLDGVIIHSKYHYSWAHVYEMLGISDDRRRELKNRFLCKPNPTISDYKDWCRCNLQDFKAHDLKKDMLEKYILSNVHLTTNTIEVLNELRDRGIKIALLSGGIDLFAETLLNAPLATYFDDYFINSFLFSGKNGEITAIKTTDYDFCWKRDGIDFLCSKYDIPRRQVAFVGDSRNDQDALLHVGLGIAFYPSLHSVIARETIGSIGGKENPGPRDLRNILAPIEKYKENPFFY